MSDPQLEHNIELLKTKCSPEFFEIFANLPFTFRVFTRTDPEGRRRRLVVAIGGDETVERIRYTSDSLIDNYKQFDEADV
jgi:hypothetical protein